MTTATLTDNASTVGKMYDAFNRGDVPYILNNVADNCEWVGAGEGTLPQGGTYIGTEAGNFFNRLGEALQFTSFNPVAVINVDNDEVLAYGDMEVISKTTGNRVYSQWMMHFRFNDEGKVVYFHDFFDTAAAYVANQPKQNGTSLTKEENIATVRNAFDDFLKGNIQGILDACTDDVEWGALKNPDVPYSQTFKGKPGGAELFKALAGSIDYLEFKPGEFYNDGNKVFVKGYHKANVKSTGKTFGHNFLMEFTLTNGKISSCFPWIDSLDQARAFQN